MTSPLKKPPIVVDEISGGTGGYRTFKFLVNDVAIGWVVIANTNAPYRDPEFVANHEYWYFNQPLSTSQSFIIEIAAEGDWPSMWNGPSSGEYSWVVDSSNVNWTQEPFSPIKTPFFVPNAATPSSLFAWSWIWPDSRSDGRIQYWNTSPSEVLDGSVGTQWRFDPTSQTPTASPTYSTSSTIPAQ